MTDLQTAEDICLAMPKIELHRHLEGSLRPGFLLLVAARNGLKLPFSDADGYCSLLKFRTFADFVRPFLMGVNCLHEPQDMLEAVVQLGEQLAADNVVYAEVTFTPQFYLRRFSLETLFHALNEGREEVRRKHDIEIRWIPDLVRNRYDVSERCFRMLMRCDLKAQGVVALGLGGPEEGHPAQTFKALFDEARNQGIAVNPHAGETAGPESVWACLQDLHAVRIGHGVRSVEDQALLEYLKIHQVMLEVCIGSNVALKVCTEDQHPLRQLRQAGCRVCLNTDDPVLFQTTLSAEYLRAHSHHGFSIDDLNYCVRDAVDAIHADLKPWVHTRLGDMA